MTSHLRSISLPSRPHSHEAQAEEELNKLRASLASLSTVDTARDGLRRVGDFYDCIGEVLCLPSNQDGLSRPQHKKEMEQELERSLELLDLCSAMQENLIEMKMRIQDVQLVLRRGDAAVQGKLQAYARLAKKARTDLKKIGSKCGSPLVREHCTLTLVVRLLIEAREMAISLLQSALCLLSRQISMPNTSKWSLISAKLQKRTVACEQVQLQALELNIGDLEKGVEFLFRRLIQSRVSLLNILNS